MARTLATLLLFGALVGCARLEGGNWPSLHEGFTPRQIATGAVQNTPEATDKDAGLVGPDELDQAPAPDVPIDLAAQIQEAKDRLEQLLLQAQADAEVVEGKDQTLVWYEAQLELSRMGRFIDLLAPYPDALAAMDSFLRSTREKLGRLQPAKN